MTEKTLTHEELCAIWEAAYIVEREKKMNKQTNEEWLNSLNTKEKAKWLSRHSQFMYGCGQMETTPKIMYEEDWEYWLKEIHDGNM